MKEHVSKYKLFSRHTDLGNHDISRRRVTPFEAIVSTHVRMTYRATLTIMNSQRTTEMSADLVGS